MRPASNRCWCFGCHVTVEESSLQRTSTRRRRFVASDPPDYTGFPRYRGIPTWQSPIIRSKNASARSRRRRKRTRKTPASARHARPPSRRRAKTLRPTTASRPRTLETPTCGAGRVLPWVPSSDQCVSCVFCTAQRTRSSVQASVAARRLNRPHPHRRRLRDAMGHREHPCKITTSPAPPLAPADPAPAQAAPSPADDSAHPAAANSDALAYWRHPLDARWRGSWVRGPGRWGSMR